MSRFITVADAHPGWRNPAIIGWAGMRGVVSLAMALSIPLTIDGQAFPHRNLILFITFIVILMTLVFQGLTLPWVIRKVNAQDRDDAIPEHEQELIIQKKIAKYSLQHLEEKYEHVNGDNPYLNNLAETLRLNLRSLDHQVQESSSDEHWIKFRSIYIDLLEHQRQLLNDMNRHSEVDEGLVRKYLSLVDLEELKIREKKM